VAERLSGADDASRYEQLEQIAYHYGLGDDAPKAAYYARLAGDKARARQADQAALAHYEQALAISGDGEGIVGERRLAYEGTGDVRALQGDGVAARRAYEAALSGADSEAEHRLKAKLALLAPMLGTTEPEVLEEAQSLLPPSALLRVWLAAALCWVHAERGEADAAQAVCRGLSSFAQAEAEEFTRGMLEAVDEGNPLLPYDDLFALFAPTYLRSTPAPSGGDS
jgi:hypothetical protein